jgi:predicted  nucleic acid-binding Zn-ribbon protein
METRVANVENTISNMVARMEEFSTQMSDMFTKVETNDLEIKRDTLQQFGNMEQVFKTANDELRAAHLTMEQMGNKLRNTQAGMRVEVQTHVA